MLAYQIRKDDKIIIIHTCMNISQLSQNIDEFVNNHGPVQVDFDTGNIKGTTLDLILSQELLKQYCSLKINNK